VGKSGILRGQSPERIAWFKEFMIPGPSFEKLEPMGDDQGHYLLAMPGEYYLAYLLIRASLLDWQEINPTRLMALTPGIWQSFLSIFQL
jgi:hypothetical protein